MVPQAGLEPAFDWPLRPAHMPFCYCGDEDGGGGVSRTRVLETRLTGLDRLSRLRRSGRDALGLLDGAAERNGRLLGAGDEGDHDRGTVRLGRSLGLARHEHEHVVGYFGDCVCSYWLVARLTRRRHVSACILCCCAPVETGAPPLRLGPDRLWRSRCLKWCSRRESNPHFIG